MSASRESSYVRWLREFRSPSYLRSASETLALVRPWLPAATAAAGGEVAVTPSIVKCAFKDGGVSRARSDAIPYILFHYTGDATHLRAVVPEADEAKLARLMARIRDAKGRSVSLTVLMAEALHALGRVDQVEKLRARHRTLFERYDRIRRRDQRSRL